MDFFVNQMKAGDEIFNFFEEGKRKVKLFAQMQAGKTGTYKYVIDKFSKAKNSRSGIKKFIVLLADSNISVKKQIENDLNDLECDIKVYHRNDYNQINDLVNTLVILDESHVAQKESNTINKIIEKMKNNNSKLLTVSATDFTNALVSEAPSVILYPEDGYYGVQEMFKNNRILKSDMCLQSKTLSTTFQNAVGPFLDKEKFALVRVKDYNLAIKVEKAIKKQYKDIQTKIVTSKDNKKDMTLNFLSNKPTKFTIVIINGAARLGRQVNTEHLAFVWDTPKQDTDTVAQSLAGRCCGYGKKDHGVMIYTDKEQLENYKKWIVNNFKINELTVFKTKDTDLSIECEEYEIPKEHVFPQLINLTKGKLYQQMKEIPQLNVILELYEKKYKDRPSVRDFKNSKDGDGRKTEILKAIKNNMGYGYNISKDKNWGITIDSRDGAIFIFEKKNEPTKTSKINKKAITHHQIIFNK